MNSIYLRFAGSRYSGQNLPVTWYKIDTTLAEPVTRLVSQIPLTLELPTNAVALGPVIYTLGNFLKGKISCEVYYFDTRFPHLGWKKAPSLNRPRARLCLVANNGKIYAVGDEEGYSARKEDVYDQDSWCEVFNPLLNFWQLVSGPDAETLAKAHNRGRQGAGDAHDRGSERAGAAEGVIVGVTKGRFWYDGELNMWKNMYRLPYRTISDGAVVDGVEYYFYRRVWGHNLGTGLSFCSKVRGLERRGVSPILYETNGWGSPDPNYPTAYVVRVSNERLCLVHETEGGVHCTRFRVSVHCDDDEECELLATVEGFRIYPRHSYDDSDEDIYSRRPQLDLCLVI